MLEAPAEQALVGSHSLVEVGDSDADVVDSPRFH
jgi:hypothetical protein